LLINVYRTNATLPGRLVDLYERALRNLCTPSQERRDRSRPQRFSPEQLLQVASRIASTVVLTRKSCVITAPETEPDSAGVPLSLLVGGTEETETGEFNTDPQAIHCALAETGLFSARGPGRLGFAHKTYGEFLAARYLHKLGLPSVQTQSLLCVPDEQPIRLIPQLHEVSAWLASMDTEWFRRVSAAEPEVLLMSDVSSWDSEPRMRLVDALLDRVEQGQLSHTQRWNMHSHLRRLAHDGINEQLRKVILDEHRRTEARDFAIKIAAATGQHSLAEVVADIALNGSLDFELRNTAAYAVVSLNSPIARAKLKPLALGQSGDDPMDQLRGNGLRATWPASLTVDELLQALTPPRVSNFAGAYGAFLASEDQLDEHLGVSDLPKALEWACRLRTLGDITCPVAEFAGRIASRALMHVDREDVRQALAQFVLRQRRNHSHRIFKHSRAETLTGNQVDDDIIGSLAQDRRRALVAAIVPCFQSETEYFNLFSTGHCFLCADDFVWCLERANAAMGLESRCWARMAQCMFNISEVDHVEGWLQYKRICPVIAELIPLPEVVRLGSAEADAMKSVYLQDEERRHSTRHRRREAPPLDPPAAKRVHIALDRCLGGEPELFWWLLEQMRLDETAPHPIARLPESIHDHPGWKVAGSADRQRVIEACRRYLQEAFFDASELLERDVRYVAERAPALAVHFLWQEDPAFLDSLPAPRWSAIGPFLLHVPVGDAETCRCAIEKAYSFAPAVMRDATMAIIRRSDAGSRSPALTAVENCLDDALANQIVRFLHEASCSTELFGDLSGWLLRQDSKEGRGLVESVLAPPGVCVRTALCEEGAVALIAFASDAGWPIVWPLVETFPAFGLSVLRKIAQNFDPRSIDVANRLSDSQLGQTLRWFYRHLPPSTDPEPVGFTWGDGADSSLRHWRDALLRNLAARATESACSEIRSLRDEHPELPWLADVLLDAWQERRKAAWTPPTPIQFLRLTRHPERRFIESGFQLQSLIVESLVRYDTELQGTTPIVPNLWNDLPDGTHRPKEENHLSDNLAQHLRRDLADRRIVINREVEICRRQTRHGRRGQETDILISAIPRASDSQVTEVLSVIVEVKGCWNDKVRTAMQTQLVDRYLHQSKCRYGLYVVGWFHCGAWDDGDYRKRRTPWRTLADAERELREQAETLRKSYDPSLDVRAFVLDCTLK